MVNFGQIRVRVGVGGYPINSKAPSAHAGRYAIAIDPGFARHRTVQLKTYTR